MQKDEVVSRVNQVLMEGFEIPADRLKPEARLYEDLELDSLDAIDMMVYLEEQLSVKVNIEQFKTARQLGDVYQLVSEIAVKAQS